MSAGYSGTPLPRKLGFKPGFRVHFHKLPAPIRQELKSVVANCVEAVAELDLAMAFVTSQAELKNQFPLLAAKLRPAGILWVSWPKKTSGVVSDLDENQVRRIGLEGGLVDIKVCAVSEIWSGLKFVRRLKDR